MRELFRRRRSWLETFGWALSVIGFVSFAHFAWTSVVRDGGAAYDLHAYLLAGRNLLDGAPLYRPMEINDPGAYRYPPTFALLAVPLVPIPEPIVTWTYRALCIACLRVLVGSWRGVGWSFLFLPVQIELIALNVTLPIAAAARLSLRGPSQRFAAAAIPATAALKFGTALLLPYLWITRARLRRPIVAGMAVLLGVFAIHAVVDPEVWRAYLASLGQQAQSLNDAPYVGDQLLFLVPSTLADFALRLGIGAVLVGAALRLRADWLAFTAAAIAVPTLWVARFAALAGAPRLAVEERSAAEDPPLHRVAPDEGEPHGHAGQPVDGDPE
jgi:Glycosyltransferase family 87